MRRLGAGHRTSCSRDEINIIMIAIESYNTVVIIIIRFIIIHTIIIIISIVIIMIEATGLHALGEVHPRHRRRGARAARREMYILL